MPVCSTKPCRSPPSARSAIRSHQATRTLRPTRTSAWYSHAKHLSNSFLRFNADRANAAARELVLFPGSTPELLLDAAYQLAPPPATPPMYGRSRLRLANSLVSIGA